MPDPPAPDEDFTLRPDFVADPVGRAKYEARIRAQQEREQAEAARRAAQAEAVARAIRRNQP